MIPRPRAKPERSPSPIKDAKEEKKDRKVKKEKKTKKRKSAGGVSTEAGPSRSLKTSTPNEDEIKAIETPSKKRKIHTVDLTNDRKPPVFINLLDSDDEDEKPVVVL